MRRNYTALLTVYPALLLASGCQSRGPSVAATQQAESVFPPGRDPSQALDEPPNPSWTRDDDLLIAPVWRGSDAKGQMYTPLWRGALPGMEEWVYTPPNGDCRQDKWAKATVRIDWDQSTNSVHVLIKGVRFDPHPSVARTEGVNWWYNPFHPAPKDFTDGAYRLWIIPMSVRRTVNLYYDPATLQLLGTDYTFPTPPPNTIPLNFPVFAITGSQQIKPAADGSFSHQFTVPWDHLTCEGQGSKPGLFSQSWVTFAPEDLCQALPDQPWASQLRPVASPWQPPADGPSWPTVLQLGLGFDFHAEETADPTVLDGNLPYVYSGVSVVSNHASMQGGIPFGWHMQILPALINVAPPVEPVPHGGDALGCQGYVNEDHHAAPMYCQGAH
jgi:hypothetical protein